jgi:hypothetical protein
VKILFCIVFFPFFLFWISKPTETKIPCLLDRAGKLSSSVDQALLPVGKQRSHAAACSPELAPCIMQVVGLHRAGPSATLDKVMKFKKISSISSLIGTHIIP